MTLNESARFQPGVRSGGPPQLRGMAHACVTGRGATGTVSRWRCVPAEHGAGKVAQWWWQARTCIALGVPRHVLRFGESLGDNLLLTCIARELRLQGRPRPWIACEVPDLLVNNPDVAAVVPWNGSFQEFARMCKARVDYLRYQERDMSSDQPTVPREHIIAAMCRQVRLTGRVRLRPYLHLTPEELRFGRFADRQLAIMSTGLNARYPILNKEWSVAGFQEVVNRLSGRIALVQLGTAADPLLDGAIDLRGRLTLRQVAGVLAHSCLFVGQAGLLMHIARAVECRSVIIFGGYEAPWLGGYPCNRNLFTPVPCSPCYQPRHCANHRQCVSSITAEMVVEAVAEELCQRAAPLEVEEVML